MAAQQPLPLPSSRARSWFARDKIFGRRGTAKWLGKVARQVIPSNPTNSVRSSLDRQPGSKASAIFFAPAKAGDAWPHFARKERWLRNAGAHPLPVPCRAEAKRDKARTVLPDFRKDGDRGSTSDRLSALARRVCRCKAAYAHPRCNDEKIRAAPGKSVGRTPEHSGE